MPKIIDLSKEIKYNKEDPFFMRVKIKHKPHKVSNLLIKYFVGLPQKLFPKRFEGWAYDWSRKRVLSHGTACKFGKFAIKRV